MARHDVILAAAEHRELSDNAAQAARLGGLFWLPVSVAESGLWVEPALARSGDDLLLQLVSGELRIEGFFAHPDNQLWLLAVNQQGALLARALANSHNGTVLVSADANSVSLTAELQQTLEHTGLALVQSGELPPELWRYLGAPESDQEQAWWQKSYVYLPAAASLGLGYYTYQNSDDATVRVDVAAISELIAADHRLQLSLYSVSGELLQEPLPLAADGSSSLTLPRQEGWLICAVTVETGQQGTEHGDMALIGGDQPLRGTLYTACPITAVDSELTVTVSFVSTLAYELALARSGETELAEQLPTAYEQIAQLFTLELLERSALQSEQSAADSTQLPAEPQRYLALEQVLAQAALSSELELNAFYQQLLVDLQQVDEQLLLSRSAVEQLIDAADRLELNSHYWLSLAIDHYPPQLTLQMEQPSEPTWQQHGSFLLTADEPITGLAIADFDTRGGTLTKLVQLSQQQWQLLFAVEPGFSGEVEITLRPAVVVDRAGNANLHMVSASADADNRPPTITAVALSSDNGYSSQHATLGDQLIVEFVVSESLLALPQITLLGITGTAQALGDNRYRWSTPVTAAMPDGTLSYSIALTDSAGNSTAWASDGNQPTVVIDQTAPSQLWLNPAISVDSGVDAEDHRTNIAEQQMLGNLSQPLAEGERVQLKVAGQWRDITAAVSQQSIDYALQLSGGDNPVALRVIDAAGNVSAESHYSALLDQQRPQVISVQLLSSNALPDVAGIGDRLTLTVVSDEAIVVPQSVTLAGLAAEITPLSDNGFIATVIVTTAATQGPVQFNLVLADIAGNLSAAVTQQAVAAIEVDSLAPTALIQEIALSNDTGSSASDGITTSSDQTLTARISQPLNSAERLFFTADGSNWQDISDHIDESYFSLALTLAEGLNTLQWRVVDGAGNIGATTSYQAQLDTTAPTVTAASFSLSADSGSSNSDALTQTASQNLQAELSAELEEGDRLEFQRDSGEWVDITRAVSDQNIAHALTLNNGDNLFALRVVDAAGNIGTTSNYQAELDTTAPTVTAGSFALSADSGSSSSDALTQTASQTLQAQLTAELQAGDRLELQRDSGEWVDITSAVSGQTIAHAITLNSGDNLFALRVVDAAGNIGTTTSFQAELDTTEPAITVGSFSLSADSGSSSSDALTQTASQTLQAELTAELEAGDRLELQRDSGEWVDVTSSVSGQTVAHAFTLNEGDNHFALRVVDAAGNIGATTSYQAELDTTAPTVTAGSFSLSADSGSSNSDALTQTASQTLQAQLTAELEAGDRLELQRDSGEWLDITSAVSGQNIAHSVTLNNGDNLFALRVVDAAGNIGTTTNYQAELDTTEPAITAGSFALSADSGSSNSDALTQTASQTLQAQLTAELQAGDRLELQRDSGEWLDITSAVSGQNIAHPLTLNDGNNLFSLRVVDAAGNIGEATRYQAELDTTPPAAGLLAFANLDSSALLDGALITTDDTFTLAHSGAEAGSSVQFQRSLDGLSWQSSTASQNALAERSSAYYFRAVVSDAAGNSAATGAIALTIDQSASTNAVTAPAKPVPLPASFTANYVELTALESGGFAAVWAADPPTGGTARNTYLQHYTSAGEPLSEFIAINAADSNNDIRPQLFDLGGDLLGITAVGRNNMLRRWEAMLYLYDQTSGSVIHTRQLAHNGNSFMPIILQPYGAAGEFAAHVTGPMNFTAAFDASGAMIASDVYSVATNIGGATTIDDSGTTAVSYARSRSGGYDTLLRITDLTGGIAEIQLNTSAGYYWSSLVQLNSGDIAVVWSEQSELRVQLYSSEAQPLSAVVVLTAADNHRDLQLTALHDGGFAMLWRADTGLHLQLFNADGSVRAAVIDIVGHSSLVSAQQILVGEAGSLVVGWIDYQHGYRILWQRYSSTGVPLGERYEYTPAQPLSDNPAFDLVALPGGEFALAIIADGAEQGAQRLLIFDANGQPSLSSELQLSVDSGRFGHDLITDSAEQTITSQLRAPLAPGEVLLGSIDGGAHWQPLSDQLDGVQLSWQVTLPSSGTLQLKIVDVVGNTQLLVSDPFSVDSTAPTQTISAVAFSADSGSSDSDRLTNLAEQTITATLSAPLATQEGLWASLDGGESWRLISDAVDGTAIQWRLGATLQPAGQLQFKVVDLAGNEGAVAVVDYTLDQTAPAPGTLQLNGFSDSGASDSPAPISNTNRFTLAVDGAEAGSQISYQIAATAAEPLWQSQTAEVTALSDGAYSLRALVTDAAGNSALSAEVDIVIDTTLPLLSAISLAAADGAAAVTVGDTVTLSFTSSEALAPGSVVVLGGSELTPLQVGADGYHYQVSRAINADDSEGALSFSIVAADRAGNLSTEATGTTDGSALIVDTTAPAAGELLFVDLVNSSGGDTLVTSDNSFALSSSGAEPGATVSYQRSLNGSDWVDTLAAQSAIADNSYWFRAVVTDTAGNVSYSAARQLRVDTSAPSNTLQVASGSDLGITALISDNTLLELTLTGDRYGGYIAAWSANNSAGTNRDIYLQRFDSSGESIVDARSALGSTTSADYSDNSPQLVAFDDGTWTLFYRYNNGSGTSYLAAKQFDSSTLETLSQRNSLGEPAAYQTWQALDIIRVDDAARYAISNYASIASTPYQAIYVEAARDGQVLKQTVDFMAQTQLLELGDGTVVQSGLLGFDPSRGGGSPTLLLFSADGTAETPVYWSSTERIDTPLTAAVISANAFAVAWQQQNNIAVRCFSNDGTALDSDTILLPIALGRGSQPQILSTGEDGSFAVLWLSDYSYALQWFNNDGSARGEPLYSVRDTAIRDLQAIVLSDGSLVVAWHGHVGGPTPASAERYAFMQRYGSDGNALGELYVSPPSGGLDLLGNLVLQPLANDEFVLSWRRYGTNVSAAVLQLFDANGQPVVDSGAALSADSGRFATDFVVNQTAQTLTATLAAAPTSDERLLASLDGGDSWLDISDQLTGSQLSWTLTLPASGQLQLKLADTANNEMLLLDRAFRVDSQAPLQTISDIALGNDSGSSDSDRLTNQDEQTITATLSAPLGTDDTLWGSVDGGLNWRPINDMVDGTAISWTTGSRLAGSSEIHLQVVDLAGNEGAVAVADYILDQIAPAPGTLQLNGFSDSGASDSSVPISNTNSFTLAVDGAEAGSQISYQIAATAAEPLWQSQTAEVTALSDGAYSLRALVTDAAGNSAASEEMDIVIDTAAPAVSAVVLAARDGEVLAKLGDIIDLTFTSSELLDDTTQAQINGESLALELLASDGDQYHYRASYTVTAETSEGVVTLSLQAEDFAGNRSALVTSTSDASAVTVDLTPPTAGELSFADLEITSSDGSNLTSDRDFSLTVTGGDTTALVSFERSTNGTLWSATEPLQASLSDRLYYFRAVFTDSAGNVSYSNVEQLTIDTRAPNNRLLDTSPSAVFGSLTYSFDMELVALPDGSYLLGAAAKKSPSTRYDLYLQRFDANGQPLDAMKHISSNESSSLIALAVTGDSQLAVASVDAGNYWAGDQVRLYQYDYQAQSVLNSWSRTNYSSILVDYYTLDAVAYGQEGEVLVLAGGRTYSQSSNATGDAMHSYGFDAELNSVTAPYGTGDPAEWTWLGATQGTARVFSNNHSSGYRNYLEIWPGSGGQSTTQFSTGSDPGQSTVTSYNSDGDLAVAWARYGVINLQRFNTAGQSLAAPVTLNAGYDTDPVLHSLDGGGFVLAWRGDNILQLRFYDANGAAVSDIYTFDNGRISRDPIFLQVGERRDLLVGWANSSAGDESAFYIQRFSRLGELRGDAISLLGNTSDFSMVELAGGEYAVALIKAGVGSNNAIEVYQFSHDDTLLSAPQLRFSVDSGRFNNDLITATAEQTITATLINPLAADEWLSGSVDGGASWSDLRSFVSGQQLSWTVTLPASGRLQLMVEDGAGNQTLLLDDPFTVDQVAPAVVIDGVAIASDQQTITATLSQPLAEYDLLYGSLDGGTSWRLINDAVTGTEVSWSRGVSLAESGEIALKVVDLAGNQGAITRINYPIVDIDTSVVLFDLVNGASSSHSGRHFSSAVDYTIYLLVDSDTTQLTSAGSGWGSWSGGANLTDSDKLVIVGDSGAIDIVGLYSAAGLADGDDLSAATDQLLLQAGSNSMAEQLIITAGGALTRRMAYSDLGIEAQLWSGTAQLASTLRSGQFLSSLPTGLLTSQGLS